MKKKHNKPMKPEEVPELRSDRDDALGYSRELFDFGDGKKPVPKKPVKTKKRKKKK